MDSSQSSDVFCDLTNQSFTAASDNVKMDGNTYDSLINNTKSSLLNVTALKNPSFCDYFASVLEDCRLCVTQALNLLNEILLETHIQTPKLGHYLEDAVTILHLLSNFIKNIVESVTISCCTMKIFPITTGQIIMDIFIHCKNSETIYGMHLMHVQQQLKDLFRTCHELQLTYLMVLEKHFVFELSEKDELGILVEALKINLHIGEVVQALDVKTMAEQWKAFTAICDKYSSSLMVTTVYQDCTMLICTMILNNMKTSLEKNVAYDAILRQNKQEVIRNKGPPLKCALIRSAVFDTTTSYLMVFLTVEQEDKVVIRSMKITNFTIKILTKMFTIFRNTQVKPHKCIVELLINIYLYHPTYLENMEQKSPHFINIVMNNVLTPAELLLKELLEDETYVNALLKHNLSNIKQNDEILGYTLLIVTLMKSASRRNKNKIINCLFDVLPDCFVWMNMGMKYEVDSSHPKMKSVGLFEYLLLHTTSVALKMSCDEYCALERTMCEALLGVDSVRALFAANLWVIITRVTNNKQLLFSQLVSLCQMYQKLENVRLFSRSPQKVHLTNTISRLFEIADVEARVKIYKHFNPLISPKNISLWSVLRISRLPIEFQRTIEEDIVDKLKTEFPKFTSGFQCKEAFDLINAMKLAATCSCQVLEGVEDILLEAWAKACPKNLHFLSEQLPINVLWFLDYIEALVSLTCALKYAVYGRSSYVIKILHVISGLIKLGNTELKLLVMGLLCNLAANPIHDENKTEAAKLTNETFKILIQDSDAFIRNTFFREVRNFENKHLDQIVNSIVCGSQSLLKVWQEFMNDNNKISKSKLKEHLIIANNFKYRHKCVEYKDVKCMMISENKQNSQESAVLLQSNSSNFDFADIETLFDNNETEEPASKKVKLDTTEVETVLDRLEQDTTLLCDIRENVFTYKHKKRIRLLYERLVSIVTNE